MPEVLYKDGNGNYHAIELIKRQRSKVYEFKRAQSEMRLYVQEVNGEGELVYKVGGARSDQGGKFQDVVFHSGKRE